MPESKITSYDTKSSSPVSSSLSVAASKPYVPPHLRNKDLSKKNDTENNSNNNYNNNNYKSRYTPGERNNNNNDRWSMNENYNNRNINNNTYSNNNSYNRSSYNNNNNSINRTKNNNSWETRDNRRQNYENENVIFSSVTKKSTGVNFDSYENIPVELTGRGHENILPIDTFSENIGIHELLINNIKRVNYTKPTPVQKYSIPSIYNRRDLMACAQTGSGKTAAFLLPILTLMINEGPPKLPANASFKNSYKHPAYPVCLVLCPTRELAIQIYEEARKFQYGTGIRTVALFGGSDVKLQLIDLDKGCDVCVATPGRLTDMVDRKRIYLSLIKYLVLDEADRMLDMGFAPQIRNIIEENNMPSYKEGRQTVMFSATFPREIQYMARDFLNDYLYLTVGRVGSTNEFILQRLIYADDDQKPKHLVKLLREQDKGLTIIFVETKKKVDLIEDYLLNDNFRAVSIHGDRLQHEREKALKLFKTGEYPILVATDVAARGLDISNITHVINCDLPTNIDDYVHRIGRTGRAGNIGIATSFVNEGNKQVLRRLLELLQEAHQEIPQWFLSLVMNTTSSSSKIYGGDFSFKNNNHNNRYNNYNNNNNSFYANKFDNNNNNTNSYTTNNVSKFNSNKNSYNNNNSYYDNNNNNNYSYHDEGDDAW